MTFLWDLTKNTLDRLALMGKQSWIGFKDGSVLQERLKVVQNCVAVSAVPAGLTLEMECLHTLFSH
jgi:hypothetical protein